MANIPQTLTRMTHEQFMALPESNLPRELIDGVLIVSPAPKDEHQRAVTRLIVLLSQALADGELRTAPTDVHLDAANVVQPDVFWVSDANPLCSLGHDGYWHGAPDLVVEILSPSTAERDRGAKFSLYERSGVREYWLVDLDSTAIDVYTLTNNRFTLRGAYYQGQSFTSSLAPDATFAVDAILVR